MGHSTISGLDADATLAAYALDRELNGATLDTPEATLANADRILASTRTVKNRALKAADLLPRPTEATA